MCAEGANRRQSLRLDGTWCGDVPALLGHTIALTGDRRSDELTSHLHALGAEVLHGAVVHTRPVADDDGRLRAATHAVLEDPPDYLLATTGIGIRGWVNAAASWRARSELLGTLGRTRILARGPKVVGALSEAGLTAWHVAASGRTSAMIDAVLSRSLEGAHVALQLPGEPMDDTVRTLRRAGARVTTLPVYEWTWPDDLDPARRLLRAVVGGRVSAVTFTSRPAVRQLAALASREGVEREVARALRRHVRSICIGPATADELRAVVGAEPCRPERSLLGELGPVVADEVRANGHRHLRTPDGGDTLVQGRLVDGRGVMVMTSDREAAVLNLLIGRPVRTVSRSEILRSVWHAESTDPSVLDTTMVRLRRRLQGTGLSIATVASRGYLLNGEVQACPAEVDLTEPGQVGAARGSRDTVRALALPRT